MSLEAWIDCIDLLFDFSRDSLHAAETLQERVPRVRVGVRVGVRVRVRVSCSKSFSKARACHNRRP